jgi:hypothetical protein
VKAFTAFAGVERPEEMRQVTRAHRGLAQQRYVKSHRNRFRSPRSGPHPGTPYRPIQVTGVGRLEDSFCFRGPISAESVRRSGLWTSSRSASDGGTGAGVAAELLQAMAHGSAAAWGHLNLLGEYDFSEDKLQDSVGIKPPKLTD